MPELTHEFIKNKLKYINSTEVQKAKLEEFQKFEFYNGHTRDIILAAIKRGYHKPETLEELKDRVFPLNIMRKIINKMSVVYEEAPIRYVSDENEADSDLLEIYEDALNMNIAMKDADRMFELFKKSIGEIYLDESGTPRLRILPAHTYFAFSHSAVSPEIPDNIWKILQWNQMAEYQRYAIYTDKRFLIVNGKAEIQHAEMAALGNPEGINPFEVLPFAYIVDSSTSTEPVPDDDLFSASVSIPILLTDLSFGVKFQIFSLIWTIGYNGDVPSSPNSVLHLERGEDGKEPSINQLKPSVEVDSTLQLIRAMLGSLLSSRSLKTSTINTDITVGNAESGIAKAIDNVELNQRKKYKQSYFLNFEAQVWNKLANYMIPYWRQTRQLNANYNQEFSTAFSVAVVLRDPKVMMTDKEQIELSKLKIENGFSTLRRELHAQYPDMNAQDIDLLLKEILEEKEVNKVQVIDRFAQEMNKEEDDGE